MWLSLGASANIPAKYLYYAYPEFTKITDSTNPWGKYRYDSLQLRVTKRFSGDRAHAGALTTVFSYTFSKPGEFDYFCALHPKMQGKVVVT